MITTITYMLVPYGGGRQRITTVLFLCVFFTVSATLQIAGLFPLTPHKGCNWIPTPVFLDANLDPFYFLMYLSAFLRRHQKSSCQPHRKLSFLRGIGVGSAPEIIEKIPWGKWQNLRPGAFKGMQAFYLGAAFLPPVRGRGVGDTFF